MRLISVNLKRHLTALGLTVLLCGTAMAETAPPEMIEKLRSASEGEAPRVARELERVWARSGSAAMDLLLKRGRDALEAKEFGKAIEHLTALTDHAPDFAEGFHARAEAYFRADLYGPALDDLQTALELNPLNYNAIFGLGVMMQEFGDTRRAADLYRRALAIHPHHKDARTALDYLKRDGIGREL
ncbi:tetratricopeptide repeat protein [Sulfitobacter aestuariivivens]|uniref:Tetratricopeptide repeat protein n=1 Tax=Sulfitobacter aestuariivivens TaxID=2766981 RepID=A0A927D012_9RHOB|nr:tetratricopeptide repeat protein [Sulfitobacter aestuariivivens]